MTDYEILLIIYCILILPVAGWATVIDRHKNKDKVEIEFLRDMRNVALGITAVYILLNLTFFIEDLFFPTLR